MEWRKDRKGTRYFSEWKCIKVKEKIKNKIAEKTKKQISAPIALKEVRSATKALLKGKSPGIDGTPSAFYQKFHIVTE